MHLNRKGVMVSKGWVILSPIIGGALVHVYFILCGARFEAQRSGFFLVAELVYLTRQGGAVAI